MGQTPQVALPEQKIPVESVSFARPNLNQETAKEGNMQNGVETNNNLDKNETNQNNENKDSAKFSINKIPKSSAHLKKFIAPN